MKIAIVTNAGLSQATQMLAGVYGQLQSDESGQPRFKIAPEFARVSYLFDLLEQGSAPISVGDVQEFEVPDDLGVTVKANLMHALGARWETMYDSMGSAANGMVGSMLSVERNRVLSGARNHIASMGMHAFKVEYQVECETKMRSSDIATERDLLSLMAPLPGSAPAFTNIARLQQNAIAARPQQEGVRADEYENMPLDQARPWSFEGRAAAGTVVAHVTVMAMTEDAAKRIASMSLGIAENNLQSNDLQAVENLLDQAVLNDDPVESIASSPAALTTVGNNRIVNSVCDNPISRLLTTTPIRVDNLHAGSEINYENYANSFEEEEGDDEDSYERPRL